MALQKQPVLINFSKGLDQKTDPYQVPVGNFLRLQNMVFDKGGRLTKRNGFGQLTALPFPASFITTYNGNLTAIGDKIQAYAQGPNEWVNRGQFYPIDLSVLPLIRSNINQTQVDAVVANNLVCSVFTETDGTTIFYKYVVADNTTGQNVLSPAAIPSNGTVLYSPRVFLLGNYFIIVFGSVVSAVNHLQYVKISTIAPVAPASSTDISAQYIPSASVAFDGYSVNNSLYIAWNGSDGGGSIRVLRLDSTLVLHPVKIITGHVSTLMSVTAYNTGSTPNIWVSFWDSGSDNGFATLLDANLNTILAPTKIINNIQIANLTSVSQTGVLDAFYEVLNNYSYDSSISTHYIQSVTCSQTGTVGSPTTTVRSTGLASKAFLMDGIPYMLAVYQSDFQPSFFLINGTGNTVAKLAYSNGGGYLITGLPSAVTSGKEVNIGYRLKDLIAAVNKSQGAPNAAGVYSQTGINLASFEFDSQTYVSEIGSTLNLTGGFPWMYDGYGLVELGFHVWPDNVEVTTATTGGFLMDQQYYYQVVYEWTDNQGNIHRSAPSVPVGQVTSGGDTSTNTLHIPTLRLTYKTANPVKIVIYRWSVGQQSYFQITSVASPLLNNPSVDSVNFTDTVADADIQGNSLIYTTGGVIENIAGPASATSTLFDSRYWVLDAEDRNLLWFSKPVIEAVPVEMSDLFTEYISPNISAQGSTGDTECIAPMDDKLIMFKSDAMYYLNGVGPDITGLNSQYSQPIFITSTVGSSNQNSILLMQDGLMFQSDKGIWLLGRGLGTEYIGAPVEDFTKTALVESAVNVPGTTQVRFTLDSGITLMYDYFYRQWGVFTNVPGISSTLYQGLHTYVNVAGQVYQETPGKYLDGSVPVLQGFTTSWISAAGLQGFQRAYFLYLLGTYFSPHKLNVQIAYDFNPFPSQSTIVSPDNYSGPWGSDPNWGGSGVWGGSTNVEQARIMFDTQKCTSFQVIVDEVFDPSFGTAAGAALTLSGLNLTIGVKKTYNTLPAVKQF